MEDKQDLFDKLMQIKDSYEPDPDLANKVIERINQREATVAFKEPAPKWFWFALVGIIVAAAVVFLSVYLTRTTDIKITIYSAESIQVNELENLESFVSENNLEINYFKDETATNKIARVIENNNLAYIEQDLVCIGDTGFDFLNLKAVLLKNAEFEFYTSYGSLTNSIILEDIDIQYAILEETTNVRIYARFEYETNAYFLEIRTNDSGTAVLEKYVSQLLNQN